MGKACFHGDKVHAPDEKNGEKEEKMERMHH
jgi:hypothetical protein